VVKVRYNTILNGAHMSELNTQITQLLLQVQMLLEDADLGEHVAIQDAFNALVCAVDEELAE
jgi:hypothetical protein